jgi:predicted porin
LDSCERKPQASRHPFIYAQVKGYPMKYSCVLLGLLASTGASALAQSSDDSRVNVFGVLDVDARAVRNGSAGTQRQLGTDGLSSSRLGWRGIEDLGDGYKAIFWLEATIAPDTGTVNSSRFFNRRSTVALSSPTLGELRLGRDYTPLYTAYAIYDPFGTNGLGEIVNNTPGISVLSALGSGTQTLTRSDNQVSYFLPSNLGGAYGQVAIAPGEGVAGSKYYSARLGWSNGPFDVSAGLAQTTVAPDNKFKQGQIGAFYDFNIAKISGQYIDETFNSVAGGDRSQKTWQIGVTIPVGLGLIRADLIHGDMSGGAAGSGFGSADDASQFALGYLYNLSKRTALYTNVSTLKNKGASKLVVASAANGIKPGETSTGYDIGIRHSF